MKKHPFTVTFAGILFAVLFALTNCTAVAKEKNQEENLELYAQSAVLMDAVSGRILFEKNGQEIRPMASTTKIMTCIVALENGNLDDYVAVSSRAAAMPKVKLNMKEGEYYRLEDLLYSLMLESHNDTAVAIAEHISGSIPDFARLMNQKARDLGCFDTYFVTPNGLDGEVTDKEGHSKCHSTTAEDLARILSYCILKSPKKEEFLQITGTKTYHFQGYRENNGSYEPNGREFQCQNHNAFLAMMDGALSGKTGFTTKAGYCYVGSLKREERVYVVALLGCGWPNHKNYKWQDTRRLMEYGLENYTFHTLDEIQIKEEELREIQVQNAQTERIGETCKIPVTLQKGKSVEGILLKDGEQFTRELVQKNVIEAPVRAGMEVGTVSYLLNGEVLKQDEIIVTEAVPEIRFQWCLKQVLRFFLYF